MRGTPIITGLEGLLLRTPVIDGVHLLDGRATQIIQPAGVTALDFVAASAVLQYIRINPEFITVSAGRVTTVLDRSANAFHYTQAAAPNQLLFSAAGGPGGKPMMQIDTVARFMSSALATPLRTTTPTNIWGITRQDAWANGRRLVCDDTNLKKLVFQDTVTPQIDIFDGGNVGNNAGGTIGSWARWNALFALLPAGCRLQVGASDSGTTLNPGSSPADTNRLIGNNVGASALSSWTELLYMNRDFVGTERTDLDTIYIPSYYGPAHGILL